MKQQRGGAHRLLMLGALAMAVMSLPGCASGEDSIMTAHDQTAKTPCTQLCADFLAEAEISCRFEAQHCADALTRKNNLVRAIDKATTPLEWTGQNSSPVDVFNRSLEQYLSLGCADAANPPTPTLDPQVGADRCAFLAASAEQQFHTLTLLLAPQR
ncbi:hypothetical protein [Rhodococcus qingshengii]|uniref:hypothetical protein n=1 Tax=Rhodococcus qingshengii TaxID=334542 RepID=UPI00237CE4B7|nr:hypothetical protein [Rhodococcus qingshengii]WCT05977.1 hypothetical protein PI247_29600 [Rhodococcus qingshengii]